MESWWGGARRKKLERSAVSDSWAGGQSGAAINRTADVAQGARGVHNERTAACLRMERVRVVYFTVQQRDTCEAARFSTDTPVDEVKELFRAAAEAGPRDVLKLYTPDGRLINICPTIAPNTPDSCYSLHVVAAHCNGMLLDELGIDLRALEQRVARLEKQIRVDFEELPPVVQDLKGQVDNFRNKLETTEHLSWLGFYKELPPPLSTEACRRLQYRRKSEEQKRRVRDKFFSISDVAVSNEVRQYLRQPTFDCHQWEDEEILLLLQQMYLDLDLVTKFGIELPTLRNFLYEVYKNYNEVPFHNFRHSFCVAQMMYSMVWCVGLPSKIGDLETLILLTSCICHDLDHPGYNNIYQINARTELALRYNDISPLENHHCSVAFRVLEDNDCNIFHTLSAEMFRQVREGVIRCILATDMARHNEILAQFKEITPEFDFSNKAHTNLLSMVLIKVADISNEARPMDVAEPWLDRLLQEFFKQSDAEKLEGLPVTPFMDREKITKPSSQCSFIGFVLLPLFEALGELFPQLQDLIVQPVRDALDYYRRLNEAAKDERLHRKSVVEVGDSMGFGTSTPLVVKSASAYSVKSRRSLGASSLSRSAEEDEDTTGPGMTPDGITWEPSETVEEETVMDAMEEMQGEQGKGEGELEGEEEEDEDEETATEVEVSEKTLKFKISTEGSVTTPGGRKSCPGSRKGSREKTQLQECHHNVHDLVRAIHNQEKNGAFRDLTHTPVVTPTSPPSLSKDRPFISPSSDKYHRHSNTEGVVLLSSLEQAPGRKGRQLCNGETKCFEDTVRQSGEQLEVQDSDNNSGTHCDMLSSKDHDSPQEDKETSRTRSKENSAKKTNILKKLLNLADRLSFTSEKHSPEVTPSHCNKSSSPLNKLDGASSTSVNSADMRSAGEVVKRAMTLPLPKTRKPQHGDDSAGKRGRRALISGGRKGLSPSSSLELLSPSESSSPVVQRQHSKKDTLTNLSQTPSRTVELSGREAHNTNVPEASCNVLEDRNDSCHIEDSSRSGEKSDLAVLCGSLDSIFQEQDKSSGNNNNHKKTHICSTAHSKQHFFSRLGRSNTHTEGTKPHGSECGTSKVQQQNWIATLAASLRAKKNHHHDHHQSLHKPQGQD